MLFILYLLIVNNFRGGSSYSWSETTYYYENGEQRSRTVTHSNPGGMSGSSGSSGHHGSDGHDGHNGSDGRFAIRVCLYFLENILFY